MPDEVRDAAVVVIADGTDIVDDFLNAVGVADGGGALVNQLDGHSLVEECHLLEAAGQRGEVVVRGLED
ncbi:MAG: hypothetical protein ACK55I_25710, partial [bacterium]